MLKNKLKPAKDIVIYITLISVTFFSFNGHLYARTESTPIINKKQEGVIDLLEKKGKLNQTYSRLGISSFLSGLLGIVFFIMGNRYKGEAEGDEDSFRTLLYTYQMQRALGINVPKSALNYLIFVKVKNQLSLEKERRETRNYRAAASTFGVITLASFLGRLFFGVKSRKLQPRDRNIHGNNHTMMVSDNISFDAFMDINKKNSSALVRFDIAL